MSNNIIINDLSVADSLSQQDIDNMRELLNKNSPTRLLINKYNWELLRVSYTDMPTWSEFVELGEYGNYIPSVEVK